MTRFAKNNVVPADLGCSGVLGFPVTQMRLCLIDLICCKVKMVAIVGGFLYLTRE